MDAPTSCRLVYWVGRFPPHTLRSDIPRIGPLTSVHCSTWRNTLRNFTRRTPKTVEDLQDLHQFLCLLSEACHQSTPWQTPWLCLSDPQSTLRSSCTSSPAPTPWPSYSAHVSGLICSRTIARFVFLFSKREISILQFKKKFFFLGLTLLL